MYSTLSYHLGFLGTFMLDVFLNNIPPMLSLFHLTPSKFTKDCYINHGSIFKHIVINMTVKRMQLLMLKMSPSYPGRPGIYEEALAESEAV